MKVLFFASLREKLGCSELELKHEPLPATLNELREALENQSDAWREALADPRLLISVNQQMISTDQTLSDCDEIAFFPPVTGG